MESVSVGSYESWDLSHWELLNKLVITWLDIDNLDVKGIGLGDSKECRGSCVTNVSVQRTAGERISPCVSQESLKSDGPLTKT